MVDAPTKAVADVRDLEIVVQRADEQACADYRSFASPRVTGAAQTPLWYETWLKASNEPGHIVWLLDKGHPVAALPLVEVRRSGLSVLQFAGGNHANGNFCPCISPDLHISAEILASGIKSAVPHVTVLSLERQHSKLAGQTNFLSALTTRSSPNIALAASLEGGFTGLLERANGKKKAKKRRMQLRRFEEAGGEDLRTAATPAEIDKILGAFIRMKRARFEKAGIPDVFAEPCVKEFWRSLFTASLDDPAHPFTLEALFVGGTPRAITGSSLLADRSICEFGAIEDDDLTSTSPGEFVAYANIEAACAKGLRFYDFSVGDEAYKRSWCDTEIIHFDVIAPLSAMGRLAVAGSNLLAGAKQKVKANPQLLGAVKALRRFR
ncbi:GNAT family N-acetyltransferase [Aliihoeflea aestuarii]|jgi:CelD/BcsL family acetyltransferase involved in cellulose biosynthesis|uniref:GNAT family N-acetyltransferase n=1 Tax=Aliihoeflea aestuarii TaxID=453840 RepID=UPI0020922A7C|nr:GNAT family N-acetyltransferase [Aliihoeflea aestuarii]MCO6391941.1 GNAT family N-acetyltransferase [Aliihoeflea aestuarii]